MEDKKEVIPMDDKSNLEGNATSKEIATANSNSNQVEYSKYMQKKIAKAKKKALHYGYSIPDLKYPLQKPLKNRTALSIIGYLILALGILLSVASVYLTIKFGFWSTLISMFGVGSDALSENTLSKTFGLSQLTGFIAIVAIVIIITILLILAGICAWVIAFGARVSKVSKVSRQEMAKGYEVSQIIKEMFLFAFFAIAGIVLCFMGLGMESSTWIISSVLALCVVLFLTLAIMLIVERKKETQWFETLSMDEKEDFIAYNDVIKKYSAKGKTRTFSGF